MTVWNPNRPSVAGSEWRPGTCKVQTLSRLVGRGPVIPSTVSESVDTLAVLLRALSGDVSANYVVDVYDLANPMVDPLVKVMALPSAFHSSGPGGWTKSLSGVGSPIDSLAWAMVDKVIALHTPLSSAQPGSVQYDSISNTNVGHIAFAAGARTVTDGVTTNASAAISSATANFRHGDEGAAITGSADIPAATTITLASSPTAATMSHNALAGHGGQTFNIASMLHDGDTGAAGASLAGVRIGWVEVVLVVENLSTAPCTVDGTLEIDGTVYGSDSGIRTVDAGTGLKRLVFGFYVNPSNGLPWTNQDALDLAAGTDFFGARILSTVGAGSVNIFAALIQFETTVERRVATTRQFASGAEQWVESACCDPQDGSVAAWAKLTGHTYLFAIALTTGNGPAGISQIDSSNVSGHETDALAGLGVQAYNLNYGNLPSGLLDPSDIFSTALVASGLPCTVTTPGQIPIGLFVSGSASVDSLPYGDVHARPVGANNPNAKQGVTAPTGSSHTYGSATLLVGATPGAQDQPLTVTLKKTSDDSVLAGPVDIPAGSVAADGKLHLVTVLFPSPATLTTGEPTYLFAESTSQIPWQLPRTLARANTIGAGDTISLLMAVVGVGGTTDHAEGDSTADHPWSLSIAPDPPTGLGRSLAEIPNNPVLAEQQGVGIQGDPIPVTIDYVHLTWSPTSLGAAFGYYEVQRQLDDGSWVTIARVRSEASTYKNDIDVPRGVPLAYRLRVVRSDLGFSIWVTFAAVTATIGNCADLILSSNFSGVHALAFRDLTPVHAYDRLQSQQVKIQPIEGRRYPVAFAPDEDGGEAFVRRLGIAINNPAVGNTIKADRWMFDPLLSLIEDRTLPYVLVADATGRTWLTCPVVQPSGIARSEPGGSYIATVGFTQIEDTPAVEDTATPWVP